MKDDLHNKLRIDNLRRMVLLSYYYKKYNDIENYDEIQKDLTKKAGSEKLVYNFTFAHLCFLCDNDYIDCTYFDGIPLEEKISEKGENFIKNYFSNPNLTFEEFEKQELLKNLDAKTKAIINIFLENKLNIIKQNISNLKVENKNIIIDLLNNLENLERDELTVKIKEILTTIDIDDSSSIISDIIKTMLEN